MRREHLFVSYNKDARIIPEESWEVMEKVLENNKLLPDFLGLYEKKIKLSNMKKSLRKESHFNIKIENFDLRFSSGFIQITEKEPIKRISWDEWVNAFLKELGTEYFKYALVVDEEYDTWQNIDDPERYERHGKDHSHLPLIPNGLPDPLDGMILDTSHNPGRFVHCDGYVEAIGHIMWLGPKFWEIVGVQKERVLNNLSWADVTELNGKVLRVQSDLRCFVDETTSDIQNRLRASIFDKGV